MMKSKELLFKLLRNEIFGKDLDLGDDNQYNAEMLFVISKAHDLAHIVNDALVRNNIVPKDEEWAEKFKQEQMLAVYRETKITSVTKIAREIFQKNQIKFIFLKGNVIRNFYPETWMRMSCDIDVLIHEDDLDRATKELLAAGFTTSGIKDYHDISFYYGQLHFELHYNVLEDISNVDGLLDKIWDYTKVVDGCEYAETPEYFIFHHLAHMAYHLLMGGCGIKPFIDLYILKTKNFYDEQKLMGLLKPHGLTRLYNGVLSLAKVWFEDCEYDEYTRSIEDFVLRGGVYGNHRNEHKIRTARSKNKVGYIFHLIFLPYKNMCVFYQVLYKHKWLLPFCYIHRIFSRILGRKSRKARKNLKKILTNDRTALESAERMLDYLGLEA